ncbi:phage tail assembly protein T [Salmonella enterica]|uniref:phage tail assembly protein T n=1 Tax=Salmonella enterica TaxID=28901 RepID=UPI0009AE38E9|nr:phage tail assembly protein T [Salmonella enterica]EAP4179729.1 phage tail assembly protein T [Salmonella enterica subsp. enterica serovar Oranienburg]EBL4291126.1 phage tail assembly protein T [Salmonella enterica subsp. enterica serovar Rubislaw]EBP4101591.1 phage tail assembly protein T [Salmonella enterica subsp. enterica]EBV0742206.1 phage tail assembly protein T [Salmonella enterica subsp. enterica serovar Poona]EBV5808306.1 phage tail assembly protein T [Salmonella enterica subsp. en
MQLAREFRRADWRQMLAEMSASELGEWGRFFRTQCFTDVWMDAQFATLKALMVQIVSGSREAMAIDFSLLPADDEEEPAGETVQPDEVLMRLGEGISGGVRYGPDSQSGD